MIENEHILNQRFDMCTKVDTYCHVSLHIGHIMYEMGNNLSEEQLTYIIKYLTKERNYKAFLNHMMVYQGYRDTIKDKKQ